jgi:nucleoid-associated protein YgaU
MSVLPDETAPPAAPDGPSPPEPPTAALGDWVVTPGESFWSIAEHVLSDSLGRAATDAEIDPYWRALVAGNRHRLLTPDPDLVRPGQVFSLPAPTVSSGA